MLNPDEIRRFETEGYYIIEDLLQGEALDRIAAAFNRLERYRNLLDLDFTFLEVAAHPTLLAAVKSLLSPHPQLLQYDGIARLPGSKDQGWHIDFKFFCERPLMVNVGVYLDGLTEENGPIWVVPCSHLRRELPPSGDGVELPDAMAITVPPGSAVIFDCTLWHRGGGNRSDRVRRAIFPTYGHYWMKRFETWMPYPTQERFPDVELSPELQELLGIRLHVPSEYSGYDEASIVRKNLEGEWE